MIKVVIFDAGNVVCKSWLDTARKYFSKKLGISREEFEHAFHACDHDSAVGKEPIEEFVRKLSGKIGREIDFNEFIKFVLDVQLNKNVVNLAKGLGKKYTVAMLSDDCEPNTSKLRNAVKDAFHEFYFSNELGMRKPDKRIFRTVINKLYTKPDECLFIDDKSENVKAAKSVGMHAVQFVSYEKLLKDLKNHGVIL